MLDALDRRHATKLSDAERAIPDADFAAVLEAARRSPTSFGLELFEIIMIQDPAHRELFRERPWGANGALTGTRGQLGTASHFGIVTAYNGRRARYDSPYFHNFLRTVKGFDDGFANAHEGILRTFTTEEFDLADDRKLTDWAGKQAYIALANMMTSAASLGIDSCPIEGFDQATAKRILADDLGYQEPAVMFVFGYRAEEPRYARTRRSRGRWYGGCKSTPSARPIIEPPHPKRRARPIHRGRIIGVDAVYAAGAHPRGVKPLTRTKPTAQPVALGVDLLDLPRAECRAVDALGGVLSAGAHARQGRQPDRERGCHSPA